MASPRIRWGWNALHVTILLSVLLENGSCSQTRAQNGTAVSEIDLIEATIDSTHRLLDSQRVSCSQLARLYVQRIEEIDRQGPKLNSIVSINPRVLRDAAALDRVPVHRRGRLHCIPAIIKDNIDWANTTTAVGVYCLRRAIQPSTHAPLVQRLVNAGALLLAKSTMPDFALDGGNTNASLTGVTKNPYALDRVVYGSSGGTGAAIGASLGIIGIGTDTVGSIVGPSSANMLVGLRPTHGAVSGRGIFPLAALHDTAGPMTRTAKDARTVFEVISDPIASGHRSGWKREAGGRFRISFSSDTILDLPPVLFPEKSVVELVNHSVAKLMALVDVEARPSATHLMEATRELLESDGASHCGPYINAWDIQSYLNVQGSQRAFHRPSDLASFCSNDPFMQRWPGALEWIGNAARHQGVPPETVPKCRQFYADRAKFRATVAQSMQTAGADFLVFPAWNRAPRRFVAGQCGEEPDVMNFAFAHVSPNMGQPSIQIPVGLTPEGVPIGLTVLGPLGSDRALLELAELFERRYAPREAPRFLYHTPPIWHSP